MYLNRLLVVGWFTGCAAGKLLAVFLGVEFVLLSCMFVLWQAGGSTGLLMDLAANEKAVHSDFFNDFEDLFDDDDIQ